MVARGVDGAGLGRSGRGRTHATGPASEDFSDFILGGGGIDVADEDETEGGGAVVFRVEGLHLVEGDFFRAREDFGGRGLAVGVADWVHGAAKAVVGAEVGLVELAAVVACELFLELGEFLGRKYGRAELFGDEADDEREIGAEAPRADVERAGAGAEGNRRACAAEELGDRELVLLGRASVQHAAGEVGESGAGVGAEGIAGGEGAADGDDLFHAGF